MGALESQLRRFVGSTLLSSHLLLSLATACSGGVPIRKTVEISDNTVKVADPTPSPTPTLAQKQHTKTGNSVVARFRYELDYKSKNATLLIRVNGVPVSSRSSLSFSLGTERITSWLSKGRNAIEIVASRTSTERLPSATVSVTKISSKPRVEETILSRSWPQRATPMPSHIELSFDLLKDVPPCQMFGDVRQLLKDGATLREAGKFAREIVSAFESRDFSHIGELVHYSIYDEDRCEQLPPRMSARHVERFVENLKGYEPWNMEPILDNSMSFDLVLGGRAFRVSGEGEALIQIQHGAARMMMEVYIARIGGTWTLVR